MQPITPISRIHFLFTVIILIVFIKKLTTKVDQSRKDRVTYIPLIMFYFRHSSFLIINRCMTGKYRTVFTYYGTH